MDWGASYFAAVLIVLIAILVWGFLRDARAPGDRTGGVDHDRLQAEREDLESRFPPPLLPPTSY